MDETEPEDLVVTAKRLMDDEDAYVIVVDGYGTLGPVSYDKAVDFIGYLAVGDEGDDYELRVS